jgi:alpha-galactosidase
MYQDVVRRFVRTGTVHRLTGQPKREGRGDRWAGFQYALADGFEQLLFVFRLHGGEPERVLRLRALNPEAVYNVTALTEGATQQLTGSTLMESGLRFTEIPEEGSEILLIAAADVTSSPAQS